MTLSSDTARLPTPAACIADFCLLPLGTATASVAQEVAEVQRVLKGSGLVYTLHSAGTTVGTWATEGGWEAETGRTGLTGLQRDRGRRSCG